MNLGRGVVYAGDAFKLKNALRVFSFIAAYVYTSRGQQLRNPKTTAAAEKDEDTMMKDNREALNTEEMEDVNGGVIHTDRMPPVTNESNPDRNTVPPTQPDYFLTI